MRLWRTLAILAAVGTLFVAVTARLLVWPARGAPPHADAIVLFNGQGDRIDEAFALAYAHVAPNLLISRGSRDANNSCSPPIAGVTVTCFDPDPVTTQGEAEFAGRMAATHHWRSVVLVTSRP
ncbi:MAG: YdcF family protein, partial [Actinobacteria bacterium]